MKIDLNEEELTWTVEALEDLCLQRTFEAGRKRRDDSEFCGKVKRLCALVHRLQDVKECWQCDAEDTNKKLKKEEILLMHVCPAVVHTCPLQ